MPLRHGQIASLRQVSQKVERAAGARQVSCEIRKSYAALTQVASCDHVQTIGGRDPETETKRMANKTLRPRHQHDFDMHVMCLDRFFNRRNVALYRTLADKQTGAAKRREILQRLVEEQARFRLDFARPVAHAGQD